MRFEKVCIKGFRNFDDTEVIFQKKTLIIGANDVGKIFLKYTGETALYILENVPGAMQYIKARYSHIIIDEYQDCGEIQDKQCPHS